MSKVEITDEHIQALLDEAGTAGDAEMVNLCVAALAGDEAARNECVTVIRYARAERRMMERAAAKQCHDCGVNPGELHVGGCDTERCPRCGGQMISCDCVYVVAGIGVDAEGRFDSDILERDYPEIYENGIGEEAWEAFDAQYRRMPWTGEWPGVADCQRLGFWCVGPPWTPVPAGTPGATEDLNRLYGGGARWDPETQRWEPWRQET